MRTFTAQVALTLRLLPKGGKAVTAQGGDLKSFDIHLTNYGFTATLELDVYDNAKVGATETDELFPQFLASDLIEAELGIEGSISDTVAPRPKVTLKGIVTQRSVRELTVAELELAEQATVRRYRVAIADPARALWTQHFPVELYADKTMQEVITDHKSDLIVFEPKWSWANREPYKTPLVFLALDPGIGKASFYDFLMWYVDRHRLLWTYDCTSNQYAIEEAKSDSGTPIDILRIDFEPKATRDPHAPADDVDAEDAYYEMHGPGITLDLPEVPRYAPSVIDSFTGSTIAPVKIANPYADPKIRRDTLLRTALAKQADDRAELERARLVVEPKPEMTLVFRRFPAKPLFPGDLARFPGGPGKWNGDAWQVKQPGFRVFDVRWTGRAVAQASDDHRSAVTVRNLYTMHYGLKLEVKTDTKTPRLPAFVEPTYPVYVEAKVLSDVDGANRGGKESLTYDPEQQATGMFAYRVEVPLGDNGANVEITVPYNAGYMPGQMFFPAYKGERVVLAMTWRKAWIDSFIDWRNDVRIPSLMQGNHMLLGKRRTSSTSIVNYYQTQTSAQPIFRIDRTSEVDRQKVVISEGNLLIEVTEENQALPMNVENINENKQD